jgi:hypothetical protein
MPPGTLLRALGAVQKRVHDTAARWNAESFPGLLTYLTVAKTVQKEQAGTGQQMKEAEERQKMAMLKADRLAQDTTSPDEKVQRNIPTHARRLHDIRRQAVKCSASIPISPFDSIDLSARVQAACVPRKEVCRCICSDWQRGRKDAARQVPKFPPPWVLARSCLHSCCKRVMRQLTGPG